VGTAKGREKEGSETPSSNVLAFAAAENNREAVKSILTADLAMLLEEKKKKKRRKYSCLLLGPCCTYGVWYSILLTQHCVFEYE
jgi:hypothetical protein